MPPQLLLCNACASTASEAGCNGCLQTPRTLDTEQEWWSNREMTMQFILEARGESLASLLAELQAVVSMIKQS